MTIFIIEYRCTKSGNSTQKAARQKSPAIVPVGAGEGQRQGLPQSQEASKNDQAAPQNDGENQDVSELSLGNRTLF